MGVTGLWKILEQAGVGHPIKLEALEGKRIAVDANVWLYKFIRGFRDKEQGINLDAHKLGLFLRICKLLFYRIKPLFVFDGPAPILKRRTLGKRKEIRHKMLEKSHEKTKKRLLTKLQEMCAGADIDLSSFKLPALKSDVLLAEEVFADRDFYQEVSSDEENRDSHNDNDDNSSTATDLESVIEINSDEDEVESSREEIQILEPEEFPEQAEDFSSFQLKKLLGHKITIQPTTSKPKPVVREKSPENSFYVFKDDFEFDFGPDITTTADSSTKPATATTTTTSTASSKVAAKTIEKSSAPTELIDFSRREKSASAQPQLPHLQHEQASTSNNDLKTNRVTDKIVEDCKSLLMLFGVPYLIAPGEAEAQCATLERLGLTHGTITDDSDIWLFGAQNVYRNFFSDDKFVMQYKMNDIEFHARLSREDLICFAMLVGSDYTDGIDGIGAVHAIEILSEFQGDGLEPLVRFKQWMDEHKSEKRDKPESKKRERFMKFELPEHFPSQIVYEGYKQPLADKSTEEFSWAMPKLEELRDYAMREIGWTKKQVDDKLLPVMKKLEERRSQPAIDSFFLKVIPDPNAERFRSKRVDDALTKLSKSPKKQRKK